ncbi:MarR family winged helix-turn-helix transcriptional regulator [Nocardioides pantholopis]|uniref:MarR family winged helix-turn-helix transcriptional regulator n=1 Tax=Nocardioides pantholopis TaxID=2483798 RepID=UPI000FDB2ADC|nr:MarR family transcriptional regulator [Nocardioides pantholopis]
MPPLSAASTGDLLTAVARSLRRRYAAAFAEWDVTPAQARALRVATEHEGARLSVIAEHLQIAPRSATEVVDALEARGLVERRPDPGDRRATSVVPSPEGLRLRRLLDEARRHAAEELLGRLGPADRAELDRILALLVDP